MTDRLTMNVSEMAKQLNISRPTAYELTKRQGFPVIRIGKRVIVPVSKGPTNLKNTLIHGTRSKHKQPTPPNQSIPASWPSLTKPCWTISPVLPTT
jgi:excisionase family DNA binding protein